MISLLISGLLASIFINIALALWLKKEIEASVELIKTLDEVQKYALKLEDKLMKLGYFTLG